jgi:hypothetical protein
VQGISAGSYAETAIFLLRKLHFGLILDGLAIAPSDRMALADLPEINTLTSTIIKAAVEVHRHLGPGLKPVNLCP